MTKTAIRWAIHKLGTEQFGILQNSREEAEAKLAELKKSIASKRQQAKYEVSELKLEWTEP